MCLVYIDDAKVGKVDVEETQLLCVKVDYLQVEVTMLLSFFKMFNFVVDENIEEKERELRLRFLLTFLPSHAVFFECVVFPFQQETSNETP